MHEALPSQTAVLETVRHALGGRATARFVDWYVHRAGYAVALVQADERLVVKTTNELHPVLDERQRAQAQRQLGRAAAQLHTIRFQAFGHVDRAATVQAGHATLAAALQERLRRRIRNPTSVELFEEVLRRHADSLTSEARPVLTHEDLNPTNVLFELRHGEPVLSGVLDFESAWSGTGESDLARLELWRVTRGAAVRDGYTELAALPAAYAQRRPVLQLLWCLEYSERRTSTAHQADINAVCAELGVPAPRFA